MRWIKKDAFIIIGICFLVVSICLSFLYLFGWSGKEGRGRILIKKNPGLIQMFGGSGGGK